MHSSEILINALVDLYLLLLVLKGISCFKRSYCFNYGIQAGHCTFAFISAHQSFAYCLKHSDIESFPEYSLLHLSERVLVHESVHGGRHYYRSLLYVPSAKHASQKIVAKAIGKLSHRICRKRCYDQQFGDFSKLNM